jgi:Ca2+-binding RTX toxin-like protein
LEGGAGADAMDGGDALDIATYRTSATAVTASLQDSMQNKGADAVGDTYQDIEALAGSAFGDTLIASNAFSSTLLGEGGDDQLFGGDAVSHLSGGDGKDSLTGGKNDDWLIGDKGDDTIVGGAGHDLIYGGDNNDTLSGGVGFDTIFGGAGNDSLKGEDDFDTLDGGAGADQLDGGAGQDTASYSTATAAVTINLDNTAKSTGDAKGDSYIDIEIIHGSEYNDTFIGGDGSIDLFGWHGNDKMTGGAGKDDLDGGDGNDTLDGALEDDTLFGGNGNDTLSGGAGKDTLSGGDGNDTLTGGAGQDTFVIRLDDDGRDTITDFKIGEDILKFGYLVNGGGSALQDLLDAGIHASSSGSTLTIYQNEQAIATVSGWTGGQVTSTQDLAWVIGANLQVDYI